MSTAVTIAVSLLLVSVGMLIAFGILFVKPYLRTSAYSTTKCRPVNVTDHGNLSCTCNHGNDDGDCLAEFPCIEIEVEYYLANSTTTHHSRLFQYYTDDYINEKVNESSNPAQYVIICLRSQKVKF